MNDATTSIEWSRHGNWDTRLDSEVFRIFPKNRDGVTFPVTIRRSFIYLRRETLTGEYGTVTFKHYLHRKNRYWKDERHKTSCHRRHVKNELMRLLFNGNEELAENLILEAEARL